MSCLTALLFMDQAKQVFLFLECAGHFYHFDAAACAILYALNACHLNSAHWNTGLCPGFMTSYKSWERKGSHGKATLCSVDDVQWTDSWLSCFCVLILTYGPVYFFLVIKRKVNFYFFFNFQMGTFKAHDGEYFLEPIMKADGSEHEDDHNKPHLIYRQELKRNYFLHSHKPCDISGKLWSASIWVKIRYYVTLFID